MAVAHTLCLQLQENRALAVKQEFLRETVKQLKVNITAFWGQRRKEKYHMLADRVWEKGLIPSRVCRPASHILVKHKLKVEGGKARKRRRSGRSSSFYLLTHWSWCFGVDTPRGDKVGRHVWLSSWRCRLLCSVASEVQELSNWESLQVSMFQQHGSTLRSFSWRMAKKNGCGGGGANLHTLQS